MSNKLIELTDRVLKEVINNEVILPSTYKEHFDYHAKEMQIDINYEALLEEAAKNRLDEANDIMKKTSCNLNELEKTTNDAHAAITNRDLDGLSLVTKEITELKVSLNSIKAQLHTDTLTRTYNRKWMNEHLLHEGVFIHNGILVFIDLDRFKPINITHGHVIGDKVLQYIASYLKTNLLDMDVIRYAGDAFIVITKSEQIEECYMRLKRLQEELLNKKLKATDGNLLHLAFSFGLTHFEAGSNFRDSLEIADSLMRENKRSKKKPAGS